MGLYRNEDKCCSCEMQLLNNHTIPYLELISFMRVSIENQNRLDLENGVMELFELLGKQVQNGGIRK